VFYQDADWITVFPMSIVGIIIYFGTIFCGLTYVAYIAPFNYHELNFREKFFFFFDGVKPSVYWWKLWIMVKAVGLNLTMCLGGDSRKQIMLCTILYTMSVSLSFLCTAWPTKVQNIVDISCGLAMIVLLAAVSFHLRAPENIPISENNWLAWTSILSLMLPVIVLFFCGSIPLRAFMARVERATQTYNLAQRFRDLMTICVAQDNNTMNGFICDLNDGERALLEEAMGICFANMFNLLPADAFFKRRLITELPDDSDTVL
jgi:hypothetical protein